MLGDFSHLVLKIGFVTRPKKSKFVCGFPKNMQWIEWPSAIPTAQLEEIQK